MWPDTYRKQALSDQSSQLKWGRMYVWYFFVSATESKVYEIKFENTKRELKIRAVYISHTYNKDIGRIVKRNTYLLWNGQAKRQ